MSGQERQVANAPGVPQRIGRYDILGPIATGGMAEILLARLAGPHGFERVVVLKRVLPHFARDESFVRMFIDEARIVSGIHHPNVVRVLELGQAEGELFLVMEYLEGEPLSGLARRTRTRGTRLPLELAAYVVAEAAAGLHAAHELKSPQGTPRDLVHRDVSPQNIFVTYDGEVKVIDFGIAKAADRITRTQTGELKGKQAYMSPEQTRLGPLDRRSDLFSLGVVLWEATLGRRLFDRGTIFDTLQAIRTCDVPLPSRISPGYPQGLEATVLRSLAEDPGARPATAADLRAALLAEARALGLPPDPKTALATWMRDHFEDRIAHKAAVVRGAVAGARIMDVPAAEVDLSAELSPIVSAVRETRPRGTPAGEAHLGRTAAAANASLARRRVALKVTVAILVAAAVAMALTFGLPNGSDEPEPTPADHAGEAREAAAPPVVEVPAEAPAANEPQTVAIDVATTPEGAEIVIAGEVRGVTPMSVELPWSRRPVPIELRREGYRTATESVEADRDVRIRVVLQRASRASPMRSVPSTMRAQTMATEPDPPPFGRLD